MTWQEAWLRGFVLAAAALLVGGCNAADDDPCRGVSCSDRGRCVSNGSAPTCLCDPGFHAVGLACVPETEADGDADADGEDGDADGERGDSGADGGLPEGPGPLTFVVTSTEFQTARLFDFDGDGELDNALADLGNPADGTYAALLTTIAASYVDGGWRQGVHLPHVDDRAGPDVVDGVIIDFHALDVDEPADPDDDFTGSEAFYALADSLDACGEPRSFIDELRIEEGLVVAGPGTLEAPMFGETQTVRHCRVLGNVEPGGASLDVLLSGVVTFHDVGGAPGLETMGDLSRLEAMLAGGASIGVAALPGVAPDVDLDADGLEGFELDAEGHIRRCVDGDRTVIEGRDCWQDPGMADGFSVTIRLVGVSAQLAGREPGWRDLVEGTCDVPPDPSLWDGP